MIICNYKIGFFDKTTYIVDIVYCKSDTFGKDG